MCGSSPRTWGTLKKSTVSRFDPRFIPTHMGNIFKAYGIISICPVHPHARGEHWHNGVTLIANDGSSPRTWGTSFAFNCYFHFARFIPTHVGNINVKQFTRGSYSVHPHARGEHWFSLFPSSYTRGSSPRTWGTFGACPAEPYNPRFIPTHVGNIHENQKSDNIKTVHPHARGEHTSIYLLKPL